MTFEIITSETIDNVANWWRQNKALNKNKVRRKNIRKIYPFTNDE